MRSDLDLPPVAGTWRTEVARARALVTDCVSGLCDTLGHKLEIRVDDPHKVRRTDDALRDLARHLYEDARVPEAEAVLASREAVRAAGKFHGWRPVSDLGTAMEVATQTARLPSTCLPRCLPWGPRLRQTSPAALPYCECIARSATRCGMPAGDSDPAPAAAGCLCNPSAAPADSLPMLLAHATERAVPGVLLSRWGRDCSFA